MENHQVGIPFKIWICAGIAFVIGISMLLLSALGFLMGYEKDVFEGSIYLAFYAVCIMGAAVSLLFRRFKLGGAIIGVFGIFVTFGLWFIGIPLMIIGLVAYKTTIGLERPIRDVLKEHPRMSLMDLSRTLKASEADIEIAVNGMIKKGERVQFDKEKREVYI